MISATRKIATYENELAGIREELLNTKAELLRVGNELSVAQGKVDSQREAVEQSQRHAARCREESDIFFQSNRRLAEKLKHLTLQHVSHGQLLNKLAADLKALGKPVDASELITMLADECEELARVEGEDSAVYKTKTKYLDSLLKTADDLTDMRTREQRASAGTSQAPSRPPTTSRAPPKPAAPTKSRTTRKTKK